MAKCSMTLESLPMEYSITGLRNSATTSRMISIDSASSRLRCFGRDLITGVKVGDCIMAIGELNVKSVSMKRGPVA